jgi:hypothetical protein
LAGKTLRNTPSGTVEIILAQWRSRWAFFTVNSGVFAFSSFTVTMISSAFYSIVAVLVGVDTFYRKIRLDLARSLLASICWYASIAGWDLSWNAFFILVILASFVSAISGGAFICSRAFGVVLDMFTFSSGRIARIRGAFNSIVTVDEGINTSNIWNTFINGAEIVVIARFFNIETSNVRIANVFSAFVIVIAQLSILPAFWKFGFAFDNLGFHASEISIAIFESLAFTMSTEPDVSAFSNIFLIAVVIL